jgi:hypothetical protein
MQVFGLGGDGRIGSLSQTSLALHRRIGKFGLSRFGCRPAWPFVGGRPTDELTKRGSRRGEKKESCGVSQCGLAEVGSRRGFSVEKPRRSVRGDGPGWLHGWMAGSRTARFQTCVGAALSASPTNSEQILQAAHHASPAAAQLNRCSSTPLPLSSPLVRRRLHHRSSLIALPRLGHSSSSSSTTYAPIPHPPTHPFRRLAGHHPRWASLRRPKRPGQRRSSSPERNLARST